jgi:LysR family glycine cleavage system transcriptional activator
MTRKLPPLNALRAFEVAARKLSFKKAGGELNLTPAAVGYQVRRLEQELGAKLFHRLNRALLLTDAGKAYLPVVQEAFDVLSKGTAALSMRKPNRLVVVRTTWSLSSKWLVARLEEFHKQHSHLMVRVESSDEAAGFAGDGIDVALQYIKRVEPRLHSVLLFAEQAFPVCSPTLMEGERPLRLASDLRYHTLLHDMMTDVTWSDWLRAANAADVDASAGSVLSHSALTIDAALAGEGVALGRSPLVAEDLASGRLVRPFETALVSNWGYYVTCLPERADEPKIKAFRDWVLHEARTSEAVTRLRAQS